MKIKELQWVQYDPEFENNVESDICESVVFGVYKARICLMSNNIFKVLLTVHDELNKELFETYEFSKEDAIEKAEKYWKELAEKQLTNFLED